MKITVAKYTACCKNCKIEDNIIKNYEEKDIVSNKIEGRCKKCKSNLTFNIISTENI